MKNFNNIYKLNYEILDNNLYIMREDMIPISFGGNKARKAKHFFEEIENQNCDYVITYGSASSNHCRIISNLCKQKNIQCTIISTEKESDSFNRQMCDIFGAEIIFCNVDDVKNTIQEEIEKKAKLGFKPYFIQGGGHGNIGTQAYVDAFDEIIDYELENNINFDYVFLASGTGTTQAGLVIANNLKNRNSKIIGISIAREAEYGKNVILKSIAEYNEEHGLELHNVENEVYFLDDYTLGGYSKSNKELDELIIDFLQKTGIPLDTTYTGKAMLGMKKYINEKKIMNKNILFIHTGGTPLFFDFLRRMK